VDRSARGVLPALMAAGEQRDLASRFTVGVIVRLLMGKQGSSSVATRRNLLRIAGLLRPHWKTLALALLAVIGETLADVLQPWPIKIVIDNVVQSKPLSGWLGAVADLLPDNRYATLNIAVGAVAAIALMDAISSYAEKYLTTRVAQWVAHDLRRSVYQHVQRLSLADHRDSHAGDLMMRMTSDISAIQDFITAAMVGILVDVLTIGGILAVMFSVNWRFTLLALSVVPVLFFVVYFYTRRIKAASRAVRKREGELLSGVAEVLSSIHVVQAFAREDYQDRRFASESRSNVEAGLQARSEKAKLSPMINVIVAAGTCIVLAYGGRLALGGEITAGVLVMFLLYLNKLYKPIRDLSKMTDTIAKASVGYERIQEVLELESSVRDRPDARPAPAFQGAIEFDRVSFGYRDTNVLSDVSFRIEPGQVAAIVGPSGTGKSTIVSLITRFYDPLAGCVKIDGTDVREYTLKSLRDQISFVLQDTLLFRATIWENIAYGRPDASIEDTVRAATLANAHEFITELPQGYATMVGDRGMTLSGGQRQRIAIARAIVRNTPILILDEPTAGLDAASEATVIDALDRLMKGRTSVVIAHHLGTIRHADIIFVVRGSQIVEAGTHDELMASGGFYRDLHRRQAAGMV
jgi:subfamily B ATP-binding cassette protein MsbA